MEKDYRKYGLNKWQKIVDLIYGERNKAQTEPEIWFRMLEESGELVKAIQKTDATFEVKYTLPDIIAWLCAFCNLKNIRLDSIVFERYDNNCPFCGAIEGCNCKREVKSTQIYEKSPDLPQPKTLREYQDMFKRIYPNRELKDVEVVANLVEEIGTVAKFIRRKEDLDILKDKLADVFAWIMAVCNKVEQQSGKEFSLDNIFFDKYPLVCPKCELRPCQCKSLVNLVFISSPMKELHQERRILKTLIEETGKKCIMHEDYSGIYFSDWQLESLRSLRKCDLVIFFLWKEYDDFIYSEFLYSVLENKQILIFLKDAKEDERSERLRDFLGQIDNRYKVYVFSTENDIKKLVTKILKEI